MSKTNDILDKLADELAIKARLMGVDVACIFVGASDGACAISSMMPGDELAGVFREAADSVEQEGGMQLVEGARIDYSDDTTDDGTILGGWRDVR